MLNDKKDNRFLESINDIDDDLIDEITDDSVRPIRAEQAPKRSRLMGIVASAASLAAMAAICLGIIYFMHDLPSAPPGGENIKHTFVDDLLEQEQWRDINSYINAADEEGYDLIIDYDYLTPPPSEGLTVGVVIDRIATDNGNEIALLGFNAWRDESSDYPSPDTVYVNEARIALVKSGRITATVGLYDLVAEDSNFYSFKKIYFDRYLDICDNIAIFRNRVFEYSNRIPTVSFYSVNEHKSTISKCVRTDIPEGGVDKNRPEVLSPVISGETSKGGFFPVYTITDELTKTQYSFSGNTYTVNQEDRLNNEFKPFDLDSIPVIDRGGDLYYEDFEELIDSFTKDMIITQKNIGDYTLLFVGTNFFRLSEDGVIYFYDPRIIIEKGSKRLASIRGDAEYVEPICSSLLSARDEDYSEYLDNAFMLGNDLFLFNEKSISNDIENIYSFNNGHFYTLNRVSDEAVGDRPSWNIWKYGYDLTVDEDSLTFLYSLCEYSLEVGKNGEYEYRVEWAEEPD